MTRPGACAASPAGFFAAAPPCPRSDLQAPRLRIGVAATFDRSVRPQDDLYRYVNGRWLDTTPFRTIASSTRRRPNSPRRPNATSAPSSKSWRRQPNRRPGSPRAAGRGPLREHDERGRDRSAWRHAARAGTQAIDAIDSTRALAERAGRLSATTTAGPFVATWAWIPQRPDDRRRAICRRAACCSSATTTSATMRARGEIRDRYRQVPRAHLHAGRPGRSEAAMPQRWSRSKSSSPRARRASATPAAARGALLTLSQMNAAFPGFDWAAWARPQGIDRDDRSWWWCSRRSSAAFAALVPKRPLSTWRAWLAARYITAMSPYVNQALSDARFEFFGTLSHGPARADRPRWKRAVSAGQSHAR